jgi:hypothetical protein
VRGPATQSAPETGRIGCVEGHVCIVEPIR